MDYFILSIKSTLNAQNFVYVLIFHRSIEFQLKMSLNKNRLLIRLRDQLNSMNLDDQDSNIEDPNQSEISNRRDSAVISDVLCLFDQLDNQDNCILQIDKELTKEICWDEEIDYEPYIDELRIQHETFGVSYMRAALDFRNGPAMDWAFPTFQHRFRRVLYPYYLTRFQKYIDEQGTNRDKYRLIAKYCYEMFCESRAKGKIIHDRTIKTWALARARELELSFDNFRASSSWINNFKRQYRISSRKIVKFVTHRSVRELEQIENESIELLLDYQDNVYAKWDPPQIFNTDQSGFK